MTKKKSLTKKITVKVLAKTIEASDIIFDDVITPIANKTIKGVFVGTKETFKVIVEADKIASRKRKEKKEGKK